MTIIWTILIGFIVGLVARAVMPGKDKAGVVLTTVLGVAGALIGSLMGRAFGLYAAGEPVGLFLSVLGAVVVLALYRRIVPKASVGRA
jgi:uncharacterized membrane protein YeaQ/YmgE (transglycosylase-associated protein family)